MDPKITDMLVEQFVNAVVPLLDPSTTADGISTLVVGAAKIVEMSGEKTMLPLSSENVLDFILTITRKGVDDKKATAIAEAGVQFADIVSDQYERIYAKAEYGTRELLKNLDSGDAETGWTTKEKGLMALVLLTAEKCGYDTSKLFNSIDQSKIETVWDAVCACPYMFLMQ